jgi:hypothetical protein
MATTLEDVMAQIMRDEVDELAKRLDMRGVNLSRQVQDKIVDQLCELLITLG